jgi:outer membrane protein assembly factor BamB
MTRRLLTSKTKTSAAVVTLGAALSLGGCSDSLPSLPKLTDLNPWAEKQVPMPGKRVAVLADGNRIGGDLAPADRPIAIPAMVQNESWSQPGGSATNALGHLSLGSGVKTAWSADIGDGSSKYGKLTAAPIVFGGKVFTLDAAGNVTAFAAGGGVAWRVSVTPEGEKNKQKGYGGGLAADGGRLYVATGYGTALGLDPASGKKLWERQIGAPVRTSPTAAADRVYFVTNTGELHSLSGADGAENWVFRGEPDKATFITNASPAVDGDLVIVPFTTGDITAFKASTGQALWTENLARSRTASSLAAMSDAARPAIDGGIAFAVGHAGRMVATSTRNGERLWSITVPSIQQPWVAGDTVYVVDTNGQVMAISKRDGRIQWTAKLPGGGTWSGPVLAGNRLWATSSKGTLVSLEPSAGTVASTQDLGAPIYIAPVVAGNRMYVLTDKARLIALN